MVFELTIELESLIFFNFSLRCFEVLDSSRQNVKEVAGMSSESKQERENIGHKQTSDRFAKTAIELVKPTFFLGTEIAMWSYCCPIISDLNQLNQLTWILLSENLPPD